MRCATAVSFAYQADIRSASFDSRPAEAAQPTVKLIPDDNDRKLVSGFVNVFGKIVERPGTVGSGSAKRPMTDEDRAIARDVVNLFGQFVERAADHR